MASLRLKFYSVAWNFRQRFFCRMTIVLWKQISASRGDLNFCLCSSIREWIQMKSKVLKSCIQNDSEMKTSISGRSERIGFHLTEGNKSSRGFFFQRELNFVLRGLSANPQNSLQNFLSTLYLSLFFLRCILKLPHLCKMLWHFLHSERANWIFIHPSWKWNKLVQRL